MNINYQKALTWGAMLFLATIILVLSRNASKKSSLDNSETKDNLSFLANKLEMGTIYTIENSPLRDASVELPASVQSAFKMSKYHFSVNTKYDISTFCYDFEVINPNIEYSLTGGLEGMMNQITQSLNYKEISRNVIGDNKSAEIEGLFLSKTDTISVLFKGKYTGKYLSYVGLISPQKNKVIQDSLFTKSILTR